MRGRATEPRRDCLGSGAYALPSRGESLSRSDDDDVAREERDPVEAAGIDVEHDEILNAHAHVTLEVDPGFDREDRATWQRGPGAPRSEARQLVRRQPDAVAETVAVHRP